MKTMNAQKSSGASSWLSARALVKIAGMVLAPPALLAAASTVMDPDLVKQVMVYGAPLALLPLALKWLGRRSIQARETDGSQTAGEKR